MGFDGLNVFETIDNCSVTSGEVSGACVRKQTALGGGRSAGGYPKCITYLVTFLTRPSLLLVEWIHVRPPSFSIDWGNGIAAWDRQFRQLEPIRSQRTRNAVQSKGVFHPPSNWSASRFDTPAAYSVHR